MKQLSVLFSVISGFLLMLLSCSTGSADSVKYVSFETSKGTIKLMLYNETPVHKENMIKLVKEGFYDGVKFHRVINEFMIQAGDPNTKEGMTEEAAEIYNYTISAEIIDSLFHKKGVLAAARTGDNVNPERKSSGTQFYIVQGRTFNDNELDQIENRVNTNLKQAIYYKNLINEKKRVVEEGDKMTDAEIQEFAAVVSYDEIAEMQDLVISPQRREIYKTTGGTPHLDMQYTVYGEVVEGMEIVDAIAGSQTDQDNRPLEDIIILKARISKR